ncbi:hypothetical protein, partial [Bacteroides intestinalis]|uniref:hypothetical protein n=1 Tax=Bacteroides intestinalis TaxID=329854 RepID=UPI00374DA9CF
RNSNSIRTLGIGTERVTIYCDFADKRTGWNRVLGMKRKKAQKKQSCDKKIFHPQITRMTRILIFKICVIRVIYE